MIHQERYESEQRKSTIDFKHMVSLCPYVLKGTSQFTLYKIVRPAKQLISFYSWFWLKLCEINSCSVW